MIEKETESPDGRVTRIQYSMVKEGGASQVQFPLSFWDLSFWLAITALILLATTELVSPYYGRTSLLINKRRLRNVAIVASLSFLITVSVRIIEAISFS